MAAGPVLLQLPTTKVVSRSRACLRRADHLRAKIWESETGVTVIRSFRDFGGRPRRQNPGSVSSGISSCLLARHQLVQYLPHRRGFCPRDGDSPGYVTHCLGKATRRRVVSGPRLAEALGLMPLAFINLEQLGHGIQYELQCRLK